MRVLSRDRAGTLWRLAEVCQACAGQIPLTKVVAGESLLPAARAGDQAKKRAEVRRRPAGPVWVPQGDEVDKALACRVCSRDGVVNVRRSASSGAGTGPAAAEVAASGPSAVPAPAAAGGQEAVEHLLTHPQGQAARQLVAYVAGLPLDGDPDVQLLAAVVAIRAAREGVGNFCGQDLKALRLADPAGAIQAVEAAGWRVGEELLSGDPSEPVGIEVPGLGGPGGALLMGKFTRSRVSGWTARVVSTKPLKKSPAVVRLAALFLAAHADPAGYGRLPGILPATARAALPDLLATGWLTALNEDGGTYRMAEAMLRFTPAPAPPGPAPVAPAAVAPVKRAAKKAVTTAGPGGGRLTRRELEEAAAPLLARQSLSLARWLHRYWTEHRHGPSRDVFIATHLPAADRDVADHALNKLGAGEWVTGVREPYLIRPGQAYKPEYQRDGHPAHAQTST
ncbi:hypothetical protein [Actinacidiphila glaucinigra]|uniref:hypothetical protein n=1 Tax=Actinacidiphila glaucinigra TaxID=235986 RepID=UPI0035DFFC6B